MEKKKILVRLMGHEYSLKTDEDPERVQRMARYIDRKMREVSITSRATESTVAMLTALMLADELFYAQDENTKLKQKIAELSAED